jgi:hypothetical protein
MKTFQKTLIVVALVLFGFALVGSTHAPALAGNYGTVVPGNPKCADLGYKYELKVEPPAPGDYWIDGHHHITVSIWENTYIYWYSTVAISAVIVKGGPVAKVYYYDPAVYSDGDLTAAVNPRNGNFYGLSHISFCFNSKDQ